MSSFIKTENQNLENNEVKQNDYMELVGRILIKDQNLQITSLDQIQKIERLWLWAGRIPKGSLTIIEGDGGRGKSTIISDLCSKLSAGAHLPDDNTDRSPMRILLLAAEDDPGMVVRPRFEAHGAVLSNIFIDSQIRILNSNFLALLAKEIIEKQIDVVVIDPIVAFLGQQIDMNRSNDVRSVLAPLVALGRETGCTFIIVRHFNKSRDGKASQKGAGSVDFRNAARSVLQVVECDGQSYLALEKTNYSTIAKTLPFSISPESGRIKWGDPCDFSAEELHSDSQGPVDRSALDEACEFLKIELNTTKLSKDIMRLSRESGISEKTMQRASKKLHVKKKKTGLGWEWSLPGQDGQVSQSRNHGHLDHDEINHLAN